MDSSASVRIAALMPEPHKVMIGLSRTTPADIKRVRSGRPFCACGGSHRSPGDQALFGNYCAPRMSAWTPRARIGAARRLLVRCNDALIDAATFALHADRHDAVCGAADFDHRGDLTAAPCPGRVESATCSAAGPCSRPAGFFLAPLSPELVGSTRAKNVGQRDLLIHELARRPIECGDHLCLVAAWVAQTTEAR